MSVATRSVGSMAMSIAHSGRWSVVGGRSDGGRHTKLTGHRSPITDHRSPTTDHKREPRLRQLKLGGANAVLLQAGAELLQRMTRGNLRMTPLVHEPADADAQLPLRGRALGFQPFEPRPVDGFKRQPELKALG